MMAGVHHQSAKEALALTRHAQEIGYDFVICLTPYVAAGNDAAILEFFRYIADRTEIGIVLFNLPSVSSSIGGELARHLAEIPSVCAIKQADLNPHATLLLHEAVGNRIVISVADEAVWFHNLTQLGHRWLLTYTPHMYQVPGWLPVKKYTDLAMAGEVAKAAALSESLTPLRTVHAKWMIRDWMRGRMPMSAMKHWMNLIGMEGGPVRPPVVPLGDSEKEELRADLERTGILTQARSAVS
jgi:4-hydroxy-tetrahydrodipicolinate synthase